MFYITIETEWGCKDDIRRYKSTMILKKRRNKSYLHYIIHTVSLKLLATIELYNYHKFMQQFELWN